MVWVFLMVEKINIRETSMKKLTLLLFVLIILPSSANFAQDSTSSDSQEKIEVLKGQVDGMYESMLEMKGALDALRRIKLTGYLQSQYQATDRDGAPSVAGGNFPSNSHSRFLLRRARLKATYTNELTLSQYVLQFDVGQSGLAIKDAYASIKDPWMKSFGLTAGVFNRPFGFEIEYSSSSRETPERSRLFQALFPGERDMGVKLDFVTEYGPLRFFNFKAGLFSGNRETIGETDNAKDFIGRAGFTLPVEDINFAVDGGISAYIGKTKRDAASKIYTVSSPLKAEVDSVSTYADRYYFGFDAQIYYDIPVFGGFSLRGEFITGKQPGTSSSSSYHALGGGDTYLRNFMGFYIWYVQNIGLQNQFVLKYDVYDPNTDITADEVGSVAASKTTAADLKYSTLGLGWIYHLDENVKFVFYYDLVTNETTPNLATYKEDLKDNVFTLRMQYSF